MQKFRTLEPMFGLLSLCIFDLFNTVNTLLQYGITGTHYLWKENGLGGIGGRASKDKETLRK